MKPILNRTLPPLWRWYVRKPRHTRMDGLHLAVPVGVFHPKLFLSTRFMIHQLRSHDLAGKSFLEIGTGSGAIGIVASQLGAKVTMTDISKVAVAAATQNATANGVVVEVVESDLFEDLTKRQYDFVAINPPYYPKEPQTEAEHAWFCGAGFTYFERLFGGLGTYCHSGSKVMMVLSEDCRLLEISAIASRNGWQLSEVDRRRRMGEWNYIYLITALPPK